MEKEISAFENISRTGNQVLDTILAAKIFHCRKNHIQITCVADGKLLDFFMKQIYVPFLEMHWIMQLNM